MICLLIGRGDDEKTYIYPDRFEWINRPDLYKSSLVVQGKTAIVQVVSDDEFSPEEMKNAAIKYMTGQFSRWSFCLSDDEPKWRKVK